jgi:hypothetical protein
MPNAGPLTGYSHYRNRADQAVNDLSVWRAIFEPFASGRRKLLTQLPLGLTDPNKLRACGDCLFVTSGGIHGPNETQDQRPRPRAGMAVSWTK